MPALLNQAREHPRTDAVVGREIADAELHAASLVVQLAIDHLRGLAAHKREIPAMDDAIDAAASNVRDYRI
jgi:hypothetical protein